MFPLWLTIIIACMVVLCIKVSGFKLELALSCELSLSSTELYCVWGEWTPCSNTCGEGTKARWRKCLQDDSVKSRCVGSTLETKSCGNIIISNDIMIIIILYVLRSKVISLYGSV